MLNLKFVFFTVLFMKNRNKIFLHKSYIETPSQMGDNSYKNIQNTDASQVTKSGKRTGARLKGTFNQY